MSYRPSLIAQFVKNPPATGDHSLIPESGRSSGEGIGYTLQYSWTSLVAQLVKNTPEMQETWVRPLGWEDHLEKGKVTHSSILAWRIHRQRSLVGYSPWGCKQLDTTETEQQLNLHDLPGPPGTKRPHSWRML